MPNTDAKITPSTADPAQQRVMMLMPLMFTFMFLWAPSGLVIYWFASNLWAIGQQYFTNWMIGPAVLSPARPPAERKLKNDRAAVIRFMQAYLETLHFFQTNKPGTARILSKYMRGVSEEHISLWCDDLRATLKPIPYIDEEALRSELEMMNAPSQQIPPGYVNNSILDEIKKSGFVEKLYRQ